MLEIFKLIYAYSKNGKLVDKEFIEKLVELEIKLKKLDSYIKNVNILQNYEENEKKIASYCGGNLNFYMSKIYEMLESRDKFLDLFFDIEKIFYQNTNVSQIILHEIEHANQVKKRKSSKTIEGDILRLGRGITMDSRISFEFLQKCLENPKWFQSYYLANYIYAPEERLAEIYSNHEMLSILSCISEYIPNLLELFKTRKLISLSQGYLDNNGNFLVSPTLKYLRGIEMDKYLLKFSWYNEENFSTLNYAYKTQFDLSERLIYGFPIDEDEYEATLDTLIRSRFFGV